MTRSAADVRNDFLEFFKQRGHTIVPGSPVVPYDDPTLLFTNAGMNQFKDVFLGAGTRSYTRAADSQPCIRAGGKHNDLDDVGQDTYHHTFFEMLGNWSFGDYFKKEAIEWAWELLTKVWGLKKDRLHATYFGGFKKGTEARRHEGTKGSVGVPPADEAGSVGVPPAEGDKWELEPDYEARDLWASVTDIDPSHIHPGSMKDNFWEMGDVGPCGPCSEIHFDLTPDKSGGSLVNAGDARVIEIWNLVFIQFAAAWLRGGQEKVHRWDVCPEGNRAKSFPGETRESIVAAARCLDPLPAKHVDTGMGFERVCALLQGKSSNYDTDVFAPIFQAIRDITGAPPYRGTLPDQSPERERGEAVAPVSNRCAESPADHSHRLQTGATGQRGQGAEEPSEDAGRPPSAPRPLDPSIPQLMIDVSYRVIADHARCLTFALNDGAVPDREGRGYVLRRILRRAVRYAWQYLDMHEPFLYKLVPAVVDSLGDAFPQLKGSAGVPPARRVGSVGVPPAGGVGSVGVSPAGGVGGVGIPPAVGPQRVAEIIREEEESFDRTLDRGIALFERELVWAITGAVEQANPGCEVRLAYPNGLTADPDVLSIEHLATGHTLGIDVAGLKQSGAHHPKLRGLLKSAPAIPGEGAFKLHDTYGFPIDLTEIMAQEKGLGVDIGEYERLMDQARERARTAAGLRRVNETLEYMRANRIIRGASEFVGYAGLEASATIRTIVFAYDDSAAASQAIEEGQAGALILSSSPFYAEKGGQAGDRGEMLGTAGALFVVEDTQELEGAIVHLGLCTRGKLSLGDVVTATVRESVRRPTMQNHTATHVMNWALREVLGDHVQQKGSLVDPEKTRFDFSHPKPLTPKEIERVEQLVNEKIAQKLTVYDEEVPQADALRINGMRAVFGEKYPDPVRVVCCGVAVEELRKKPANPEWRKYPIELCGGTHCKSTGQIERFAIVSEEAVAKGIRRLVGIAGERAQDAIDRGAELLRKAEELRSTDRPEAGPPKKGAPSLPGVEDEDVAARASRGRDVGARARTGRTDRLETGPTAKVAADVSSAAPDLATQVAELQQTVAESTLCVVDRLKLRHAISELQKLVKAQQKQQAAAAKDEITDTVAELLKDAPKIGETTIVVAELPDLPIDQLKTGADMVKQKCKSAAVLFGVRVEATKRRSDEATKATAGEAIPESEPEAPAKDTAQRAVVHRSEPESQARAPTEPEAPARAQGKAILLAAMSNDLVKKGIKAGDLIKHVAPIVDGRGGGPPTMAQAGGKRPDKIPKALDAATNWIGEKLS